MIIVLFVCTANIARSPMAAALFNKELHKMMLSNRCQALSAGTWGEDGHPAAVAGVRVMKTYGIDISTHRSRIVTEDIISTAQLVLTMEKGHKEALRAEFPQYFDKILLLTEIIGLEYDIPDPFGMGRQYFEETASELEAIINEGMDEILRRIFHDG